MYSLVLPHQNTCALLVHIISYIYYVNKQVRSGAFVWPRPNEAVKIMCRDIMYFSSRTVGAGKNYIKEFETFCILY